jgi:hypothetical protein
LARGLIAFLRRKYLGVTFESLPHKIVESNTRFLCVQPTNAQYERQAE